MSTSLGEWMRRHHGIAHTRHLREAGFSRHQVAKAVDAGHLQRVHRTWLVAGECSAARRAAAEVSGRVTCVTAAAQRGLWTPDAADTHVWVPPSSAHSGRPGLVLHRATAPAPVARFAVEEPMLNVLFHVARCVPPVSAAAVWESGLRTGAVTLNQLRRTEWGATACRAVLDRVGTGSDSGVETAFLAIARSCGVEVQQQVRIDGHRVDALIGERLVIQLDGFEFHGSAKDRRKDLRQDARLALLGYTVLRFDYQQVMFDMRYVQETLLNAIAQGLHRASHR
ncbi:type IV toxin-antitoxin system AbiEi family antitoxin domain-containing protein [Microbacterium sp. ARD32]|uniref:type IV toxin-antitoxin system AbiEi family antitoxin domain-containing protein n=1 Tax=Microbacterium sp. ARD32 TaxID=2962577 RepID=UPI002882BA8E|nr:type IV toxin-antitoxin system AbiEi family antitoxin domain-containing protein [Microbacterium sp. ARD32]MDT0156448.1 type IV toxin-antitoxin system AbiEi family antitoxin domain-containing protein [Microbacterium sp. ARD32]